MTYDLMSLPQTLVDLDCVPAEFRALYMADDGNGYVLTETAQANFQKIAAGVAELAEQRDKQAHAAQAALVDAQVLGAILVCGAAGPLAAGAAAQFCAENIIVTRDGHLVVETGGGDVPLKDAVSEFMHHGAGSVFLPRARAPEQDDYFLRRVRSFK